VYWTNPKCRWSALNERSFRHLYETKHDEFDFVAVVSNSDALSDALARWNAPCAILVPPPPKL
jgi:hypothetical protein